MPRQRLQLPLEFLVCVLTLPLLLAAAPARKVLSVTPEASSANGMMSMPMYAPLFVEDQDHSSTLTMVNQLASTVHATVLAKTADGSIIGQRVVAFAPSSQQVVELRDILRSSGITDAVGSVEVVPDPMEVWTMAILAQLSIVGTKQSAPVYLEEELLSPDPMQATVYRATVPSATGSPQIAVLNTAATEQTLSTTCVKANGERFRRDYPLAPSELAVVSACRADGQGVTRIGDLPLDAKYRSEDKVAAVAIEVSSAGGMGTFAAWAVAPARAADSQVLLSLNLFNSGQAKSADTIFAGVPVGPTDLLGGEQFVPELAVANFGTKPIRVTVLLSAMSGDDPRVQTVADLALEPGAVRDIDIPNASGDSALRNSFTVNSDGQPGTVISNLILRGQRIYPAIQLIGKDGLDVNNAGDHPWSIANGDESTLLLFNHSAKPILFNVDVAAAGEMWRQLYQLRANETRSISIRQLVLDQVTDLNGKKLPADARFGNAGWFTKDLGTGTGRMFVSNPLSGLSRNFSCGGYLVLCGAPGVAPATFGVGQTATLGPLNGGIMCVSTNNPNACTGQQSGNNGSGFTYLWSSSNSSIAQVSGSTNNSSATFQGDSSGTAQAMCQMTLKGCSFTGQGTIAVVSLTCSPSTVSWTGTVNCTVAGAAAGQVSQWKFSGPGGTVSGPTGVLTWAGPMVASGTVTATVAGQTLSKPVTVNPRSSPWTVAMPAANQVANGSAVGTIQLPVLTSPPTTQEGSFGQSAYAFNFDDTTSQIQSGPNTGIQYVATFSDLSAFGYELNPGLTNPNDPFYQHQGNCHASIAQIVAAVQAHEAGLSGPSHYSEAQASLASNNPGSVAASAVGTAASIDAAITAAYQAAYTAATVEPNTNLPPNINYYPYTPCQ